MSNTMPNTIQFADSPTWRVDLSRCLEAVQIGDTVLCATEEQLEITTERIRQLRLGGEVAVGLILKAESPDYRFASDALPGTPMDVPHIYPAGEQIWLSVPPPGYTSPPSVRPLLPSDLPAPVIPVLPNEWAANGVGLDVAIDGSDATATAIFDYRGNSVGIDIGVLDIGLLDSVAIDRICRGMQEMHSNRPPILFPYQQSRDWKQQYWDRVREAYAEDRFDGMPVAEAVSQLTGYGHFPHPDQDAGPGAKREISFPSLGDETTIAGQQYKIHRIETSVGHLGVPEVELTLRLVGLDAFDFMTADRINKPQRSPESMPEMRQLPAYVPTVPPPTDRDDEYADMLAFFEEIRKADENQWRSHVNDLVRKMLTR